MFQRSAPFAPRPIRFLRMLEWRCWRLKVYSVTYGATAFDSELYSQALSEALSHLPLPAVSANRPGVGFAICHQGKGWHYLVLCWWDNQNELLQRVFVRECDRPAGAPFRLSSGDASVCVWDLQIVWFEREVYVRHVLAPVAGPDLDRYLSEVFTECTGEPRGRL